MIALQNPSIFFLKRWKWDYKKPNYKPKRGISNLANNIAAAVKLLELKTDNFVELLHHSWQKLRAVLENYEKKAFDGVPNSPWGMHDFHQIYSKILETFFSLSFFHFVLDHFKEGGLEKRQNTGQHHHSGYHHNLFLSAVRNIHGGRGLYFNEGEKNNACTVFYKSRERIMNMHDSTDKMAVECLSLSMWPLLVKKKEFPLLIMIFIFSTSKLMMTRGHRLCVVLQHNRRQQNHDDVKAMGKLIRKIWFDFVHHGCSSETSHRTFSKRSYTYIQ